MPSDDIVIVQNEEGLRVSCTRAQAEADYEPYGFKRVGTLEKQVDGTYLEAPYKGAELPVSNDPIQVPDGYVPPVIPETEDD